MDGDNDVVDLWFPSGVRFLYTRCFQTIPNQNLKATLPLEEGVAIFKRAL